MPRVTGKDTQLCVNHISLLWSELGISPDELPLKLEVISHLDCLVQVCNEVLNVIVDIGFSRCRRLTCRCGERFELFRLSLWIDDNGHHHDHTIMHDHVEHVTTLQSKLAYDRQQGASSLSAVLRSDTAIEVSVKIMDAFVEMRHFIADNAHMFDQIREVSRRQIEYQAETNHRLNEMQRSTDERFERVFDCMGAHEEPRQMVFFEGQVYDAFELLVSLVRRAKESVVLIDGYVDAGTLNILAKKADGVTVTVWTHPKTKLTAKDVETFNVQYPKLTVRHTSSFHDRFLILDETEGHLVGASLKDAGRRSFAITRIDDRSIIKAVLSKLAQQS